MNKRLKIFSERFSLMRNRFVPTEFALEMQRKVNLICNNKLPSSWVTFHCPWSWNEIKSWMKNPFKDQTSFFTIPRGRSQLKLIYSDWNVSCFHFLYSNQFEVEFLLSSLSLLLRIIDHQKLEMRDIHGRAGANCRKFLGNLAVD